jgi:hypothetical protein
MRDTTPVRLDVTLFWRLQDSFVQLEAVVVGSSCEWQGREGGEESHQIVEMARSAGDPFANSSLMKNDVFVVARPCWRLYGPFYATT